MSNDKDLITHITGNVGQDPKVLETKVGEVTKFSVAVTMKYGENPITRWVQVAVFNADLQEQVRLEIEKGTKVAVEGRLSADREYKGEKQYDMVATRIGLVSWFTRSKSDFKAKPKVRDEESDSGSSDSGLGW